ncbi:MAG: IS30 family transposase [Anaerotruncus sp.]|jgi:IS30 family transposase|nr:IS30 family transposase [Anaerotruncus sp.]
MGHCFSHLTKTDRYKIEAALLAGEKPQAIADRLHVHVSTIYREKNRARMIHRNSDWTEEERYNPDEAHRKYREHLSKKGAGLKIGKDKELADYLEKKVMEDGYSPAAALASIELEGKTFSTTICVSTFYSYITKGVFLFLTNENLPEKPKRKRTYKKVKTVKRPPKGDSIEKRPPEIEERATVGDWEMDTVYSSKKGEKDTLLVLTERKSRIPIMELMPDRTRESVVAALDRIERRFGARRFRQIFRTITVDNGGEFADVERLERSALCKRKRTKVYFCHPYSSYERGSNENENKMIRRHFPKGTDFGKVTAAQVKRAERWIARYPRKILGWKTSEIVFNEYISAL